MPIMDGPETAAIIWQRPQSEMTPIIFITAFGNRRDREHRPLCRGGGRPHPRPDPTRGAPVAGVVRDLWVPKIPSTGSEQHERCPGIQIGKHAPPGWWLRRPKSSATHVHCERAPKHGEFTAPHVSWARSPRQVLAPIYAQRGGLMHPDVTPLRVETLRQCPEGP
jgi:CheY-like chemotaxis protein